MRGLFSGLAMGLALIGSSAIAAPTPTAGAPATSSVQVTAEDRAEFRQDISVNPVLVMIMEAFPADYAAFETAILRDSKAGSLDFAGVRGRTNAFITQIQDRFTPFTAQAPDADLVALVTAHVEVVTYLQGVNLRACYEMSEGAGLSPETIETLASDAVARLQAYNAIELRTGIKGQKTRIERGQPSEKDLESLIEAYDRVGGDLAWLTALNDGTTARLQASQRCSNGLAWMRAVLAQPPETVGRIIAMD